LKYKNKINFQTDLINNIEDFIHKNNPNDKFDVFILKQKEE
jgi:hypothetical protein